MPLKITIPGADFSGLGLPKFIRRAYGFPADALAGLYLFENVTIGDPVAVALDYSGSAANAPLLGGSVTPTRTAAGATFTSGNGMMWAPPIAYGGAMSGIAVLRCTSATANGFYPAIANRSGAVPNLAGDPSYANTLAISFFRDPASTSPRPALFANPDWTSPAGVAKVLTNPGALNDWFAVAWSIDPATGTVRMRTNKDQEVTAVEGDRVAEYATRDDEFWRVGFTRINGLSIAGDIGLFALYSAAFDQTGLSELISAAAARMAGRGVTL